MGDYYRPFGHQKAPPWLPKPTPEEERARWAESVIRLELKRDLRRRGIPFAADDSTALLGAMQELAHILSLGHGLVSFAGPLPASMSPLSSAFLIPTFELTRIARVGFPFFCFPQEPE